jgi:hypothetical protein
LTYLVRASFRTAKGPRSRAVCHLTALPERPVYHRRPDRVRHHARICFLAYWLSAKLE